MKAALFISFMLVLLTGLGLGRSNAADFTSVQNGNWDVGATWGNPGNNNEGSGYPGAFDNAIISGGYIMFLRNNATVSDVTIHAGATLSQGNNKSLTVLGNYVVNGTHAGSTGARLNFSGADKSIDGSGTVSLAGDIYVSTSRSILSTANLVLSCDVIFLSSIVFTNYGEVTVVSPSTVSASAVGPTWVNEANSTFNLGAAPNIMINVALIASAVNNTINYYQEASQNIKLPNSNTYYHLHLTGSGTKNLIGNIIVEGDLFIDGSTLSATSYTITLKGNWRNAGILTAGSGNVIFSGGNPQTIANLSGEIFYNMTVSKSGGNLMLENNVTVSNTLNMSSGMINANQYSLILGTSSVATGTLSYTSGLVFNGKFQRWVSATGLSLLFPLGVEFGFYTPLKVSFNNLSVTGSVEVEFLPFPSGNNGAPLVDGAETVYHTYGTGYYTFIPLNGLMSNDYSIEAIGLPFYTLESSTRILTRVNNVSNWTANGTHADADLVTGYARRTNINQLPAEFALADVTNCMAPVSSSFTGPTEVCINASENYSVSNNPGNVYTWFVVGGTQTGGGSTNSITVDWGSAGMTGFIVVVETNACGSSQPILTNVNISPVVPTTVSGKEFAPENTSSGNEETYSVPLLTGYTYAWTINGGSIITGAGTNSVAVQWGPSGSGEIAVAITTSCGTVNLILPVQIYVVINSVRSGSWNSASTWDCNCVPTAFNSTRVKNPHTITFPNSNLTIKNLISDVGGTYNNTTNKTLTVIDDILINGVYKGTSELILSGSGKTIDGIGTISTSGNLTISGGSKTILPTAVLSRTTGSVEIGSSINLTNWGSFSVSGNINGAAASSYFINEDNSSLYIGGALLTLGTLVANADFNLVEYTGSVSQNVVAGNYYSLQSSGTGARILPASTVGIAGNFVPGTNAYTITNNTINFNGASDQEIPEFSYNHLALSIGGTKIMTGPVSCMDLTIGTFTILDPDLNDLYVQGNWTNNGMFTQGEGHVFFNGSVAQTIAGPTDFYNLSIQNASGVSLNSMSTLTSVLTLTSGLFTTNGNLSIDLNTGAISGTGTGTTSGNIRVYKDVSSAGYHYLSTPLSNVTAAQLNDDVTINTSGYPNFYHYDETNSSEDKALGWTAITSTATTLTPMKGYALYFFGSRTIDFFSTYNHTTVPSSLTLTNTISSDPGSDGWHLVGNPYPSTLDWDAVTGWTKTNLDGALYFWDAMNNRNDAYVNGVGQYAATQYIPAMQGFWVQVSEGSSTGTFGMNNNVRMTYENPAIWRKTALTNVLRMKVSSGLYSDAAVVRFSEEATNGFDKYRDARNRTNSGKTPSVFTRSQSETYSINDLPLVFGETKVPLVVNAAFTGEYTFSTEEVGAFDNGVSILLEDKLLNTYQDLSIQPEYKFSIEKGDTSARFYLVFREASTTGLISGNYGFNVLIQSYEDNVLIHFKDIQSGNASVIVYNAIGQEVQVVSNAEIRSNTLSIPVKSFSPGIHVVKIMNENRVYSGKVYLGN